MEEKACMDLKPGWTDKWEKQTHQRVLITDVVPLSYWEASYFPRHLLLTSVCEQVWGNWTFGLMWLRLS